MRCRRTVLAKVLCGVLSLSFCAVLFVLRGEAELIDKVVAFVDDQAITLSDLNETYEATKKFNGAVTREEVLNTMIHRVLLLREARKLKLIAKTDDELLNEYIELKVRAYIRIREEELEYFYSRNVDEFKGASFDSVRDRIEDYLTEKEVNNILRRHLHELKAKAYVKVLDDE